MPALAFLLLYLVWVFMSFLILFAIGIAPTPLGTFFTSWTILLDNIAVGVLTIYVLTTQRRLLGLIDAILLPSIFIAFYGIYGYLTKQQGILDTTTSSFRISSIFGVPPTLALFLSVIIPLSFYRTFTLSGFKRVIGVLVTLLLLVTLGLTFTRAALLTVPISLILMTLFLPSRKLRMSMFGSMLALAGLIALAATIANTAIFSRFFNQDITTLNGRTYLWAAILDRFDPTQLLGHGLGASDVLLTNLQVGFGGGAIATAAHEIFLETLYDHGVIGLVLFILTLLALVVPLLSKMRKATPDYRMLLATVVAVFFNVFIQSFQTDDLWNPSIDVYFWIIMALPFALCWITPKCASEAGEFNAEQVPGLRKETMQQDERKTVYM
jgi:O-antigen ligase